MWILTGWNTIVLFTNMYWCLEMNVVAKQTSLGFSKIPLHWPSYNPIYIKDNRIDPMISFVVSSYLSYDEIISSDTFFVSDAERGLSHSIWCYLSITDSDS